MEHVCLVASCRCTYDGHFDCEDNFGPTPSLTEAMARLCWANCLCANLSIREPRFGDLIEGEGVAVEVPDPQQGRASNGPGPTGSAGNSRSANDPTILQLGRSLTSIGPPDQPSPADLEKRSSSMGYVSLFRNAGRVLRPPLHRRSIRSRSFGRNAVTDASLR